MGTVRPWAAKKSQSAARSDAAPMKRLRRGRDPVIGGVCSGLAETLRVDVLLVRVGFVVLAVAGGIGVPLYLVLWFVMSRHENRSRDDWHESIREAGESAREWRRSELRQPLAIGL